MEPMAGAEGEPVTMDEITRILARLDSLEADLTERLARIEADLSGVLDRERTGKLRAQIEEEFRRRYGVDEVTDPSVIHPLPVRVAPARTFPAPSTDAGEEKTDPLDGLVNTVRSNYRFSVAALLMLAAIIFGGIPQMIAAFQALGYLPPSPVQVELQAEPAPFSPFTPEPLP